MLSVIFPLLLPQTPPQIDDDYLKLIEVHRGKALADPSNSRYLRVRIKIEPRTQKSEKIAIIDGWVGPDRKTVVLWDGLRYPIIGVVGKGDLEVARRAALEVVQLSNAYYQPWFNEPLKKQSLSLNMANPVAPAIWYLVGETATAASLLAKVRSMNDGFRVDLDVRFRTWLADRLRKRFFEHYHRREDNAALADLLTERGISGQIFSLRSVGRQNTVAELIAEVRRRQNSNEGTKPESLGEIVQSLEHVEVFPNWSPNQDPILLLALSKGPAVVPPMIHALKSDLRLTRAEFPSRNFSDASVAPVSLAASYVLQVTWPEFVFYQAEDWSEADLQTAWARQESKSRPDRLMDIIEDPRMPDHSVRSALRSLIAPASWEPKRNAIEGRLAAPRLRDRIRSAVVPRFDLAIAQYETKKDDHSLRMALDFGGACAQWDFEEVSQAARKLTRVAIDRFESNADWSLLSDLSQTLSAGIRHGDPVVLKEYARLCGFDNQVEDWIYAVGPARRNPENESAQAAARIIIFKVKRIVGGEEGPAKAIRFLNGLFQYSISDLLAYKPIREVLLRALDNSMHIVLEGGPNYLARLDKGDLQLALKRGPDQLRLRVDDFCAWKLSQLVKTGIEFSLLGSDVARERGRGQVRQWLQSVH